MNSNSKLVFSLPFLVWAITPSLHAALLIDNFNNTGDDGDPINLTAISSGTDSQIQTSPLVGSISDNRDALLDEVFGIDGVAIADQINPDTNDGYISFSALNFFSEADLVFFYGDLGGIDLTQGGTSDAFELFVRSESSFGIGDASWAVGVEDTDGEFDITDDFSLVKGFNRISFPDTIVDYTSVRDIHLYVNAFGIASIESIQVDDFQVVPEPGAFTIVACLAALGLVLLRRRAIYE